MKLARLEQRKNKDVRGDGDEVREVRWGGFVGARPRPGRGRPLCAVRRLRQEEPTLVLAEPEVRAQPVPTASAVDNSHRGVGERHRGVYAVNLVFILR